MKPPFSVSRLLIATFVAGGLDIAFACIFWRLKADVASERIFQSVAAGILGETSFQGGATTALLGLFLHFFIIFMMAVFYFIASRCIHRIQGRPLLFGALYGLALYVAMNFIVVPLSAASPGPADPTWIGLSVLVHMFLVGVPIALAASGKKSASDPEPA